MKKRSTSITRYHLRENFINFMFHSRFASTILLAVLVGVLTGFGVVGFVRLIDFLKILFFDGGKQVFSFLKEYYVIVIPALGALLVGPLVVWLAPEAKGHGVPEVMKAIAVQGGRIRPIVVVVKAFASAIAIGSGASVGREGPIVQVGSALGSSVGQLFKQNETRIKNLIACGAAAGIAGVFNAPIAGVMFALEVILKDFGARAMSSVVIAAVSASVVSRMFLGDSPAFVTPSYTLWSPFEIPLYFILGIVCGLAALAFVFVLYRSEDIFEAWKFPEWLKPAVGGLLLGVLAFFFPQVLGTGFQTIEDALHGQVVFSLLAALIVIKIIATSLTLGSGNSGGVFAPALFIGAVLGGSFGNLFYNRLPFPVAPPGAYAVVGMASVFAAAAHAPVTAILIVFEMTGDYQIILPLMISTVVATIVAQTINKESIYSTKLKRAGIDSGALEEVKVLGAIEVRDAMNTNFETIARGLSGKELLEKMSKAKGKSFFVVDDENYLRGVIKPEEVQKALFGEDISIIIAEDISNPVNDYCFADDALSEVAKYMRDDHITELPVMDPTNEKKVIGVLKSEDIFNAYLRTTTERTRVISELAQRERHAGGMLQVQFVISGRSPFVGKPIKDLALPHGVVLTSIQRRRKAMVPEGNSVLRARDKIWAVFVPDKEEEFREWLKKAKLSPFSLNAPI